jgi:membrane protease YdiL (CAAX protease family)
MPERRRERTRAEVSFHWALAAVLVPVLALPVVWGLAVHNLRHRRDDPTQRRWAHRLVGLAIVDTLVAISLVASGLTGMQDALASETRGARIGAYVESAPEGGVRVREVFAGSPAEEAGIRAGDRIVRVGERPVDDAASLASAVSRGELVVLHLERDGRPLAVEVEPRTDVQPPTVVRTAERCAPASDAAAPRASPWDLAPYALFLLIVVVVASRGRRRRVKQWTFWIPFFGVLLLASVAGTFGTLVGCAIVGGSGTRASAIGLLIGEVVLAAIAVLWLAAVRRRVPEVADERPRWSVGRTYVTALLYAAAWMPRVAILSVPLLYAATRFGVGEVSPALEGLLGMAADPWTAAFVFVSAVVLAPIAEETLFRGLMLPHLARTLSVWPAIYVGALLFGLLHVSHGVMLIGPLVLGAVLGWARLRSRGLTAPILLHVTFNAFATLSGWFA